MTEGERDLLTIKEAAELRGWNTQNLYYHFKQGNLTDYGATAAADGRDPALRVSSRELEIYEGRARAVTRTKAGGAERVEGSEATASEASGRDLAAEVDFLRGELAKLAEAQAAVADRNLEAIQNAGRLLIELASGCRAPRGA